MIVGLIVLGGGLGAVARWSITALLGVSDKGFPVGTTVVNVLGSFALGVAVGLDETLASFDTKPLTVGLLGGFTTFSTWMVQIESEPDRRRSDLVAFVPLVLGVAAAVVGLVIGRVSAR